MLEFMIEAVSKRKTLVLLSPLVPPIGANPTADSLMDNEIEMPVQPELEAILIAIPKDQRKVQTTNFMIEMMFKGVIRDWSPSCLGTFKILELTLKTMTIFQYKFTFIIGRCVW